MLDGQVTAWEWAADQSRHPEWAELRPHWTPSHEVVIDSDRRVYRGLLLAACGGSQIPANVSCNIDFTREGITIAAPAGRTETVRYDHIEALQITGSTTRRNAGVIGGGFGLIGVAEGVLAAAVINAITTRTKVYTVLRIATRNAEYVFVSYVIDSHALQMSLVPVQVRIRQAKAAPSAPPPPAPSALGVADELTKLAQLHAGGILNDAEFASAKARLLGG